MDPSRITWDDDERRGCVEASDIGLAPGIFPRTLDIDGLHLTRGDAVMQGGELRAFKYSDAAGRTVDVIND